MAIQTFLAMTAAEMYENTHFPRNTAWMACHFSPYSIGLSNLPDVLPKDSLLILNDRTPIHRHDPDLISRQLAECVETLDCRGLLLDFQRPGIEETRELVQYLTRSLSCPLGVSESYAEGLDCAVFLPPVPPTVPLQDHLAPWKDREIWLELALDGEIITLTEQGAKTTPLPFPDLEATGFRDEDLHCHYQTRLTETAAEFTLWRTPEDLDALIAQAEQLGVTTCIGLYQELSSMLRDSDHL